MKIICLGNEFIKEDSFAKKVGKRLIEFGYDVILIDDSFQLIEILNESNDFIIIDVVKEINDVREIKINDVKSRKLVTTHDFDCGFVLKMNKDMKNIKIIGVSFDGDLDETVEKVRKLMDFLK